MQVIATSAKNSMKYTYIYYEKVKTTTAYSMKYTYIYYEKEKTTAAYKEHSWRVLSREKRKLTARNGTQLWLLTPASGHSVATSRYN